MLILDIFQTRKKEDSDIGAVAMEDDSAKDEGIEADGHTLTEGFLWQYTALIHYGKTREKIIAKISRVIYIDGR